MHKHMKTVHKRLCAVCSLPVSLHASETYPHARRVWTPRRLKNVAARVHLDNIHCYDTWMGVVSFDPRVVSYTSSDVSYSAPQRLKDRTCAVLYVLYTSCLVLQDRAYQEVETLVALGYRPGPKLYNHLIKAEAAAGEICRPQPPNGCGSMEF